jgi:uncharacterized protein YkwD
MPSFGSRALARATLSLLALGAAFAAAPAHAASAPRCPGASAAPAASTADQARAAVVCLINAERSQRGLHRLHHDRALGRVARGHAADMVRRSYFSHVTPGGAGFGDRVRAAGYGRGHRWRAGEAIGWGTGARSTPAVLVREWLASPEHREILLDPQFRDLGVGVVPGAPRPGLAGGTYSVDLGVVR